jgi:hexosaminidase
MLDTSRHYYPVEYIYHLIDSLMFNKLNVLHWHIVDEDSFPLEIPVNPNLSKMGSFNNKTYSPEQISSIVDYGLKRAVRIIPEIDTPAHTESWGRSLQPSDFVMLCSNPYAGQFDPTMDKTYEWVDQVLNYTVQKFPDSFVHFGGDEVRQGCWGSRSSIKDFMAKNNLTNYNQLEVYYRKREKANYRKYSNKTVMYWAN